MFVDQPNIVSATESWYYYRPHPKDGGRYCFQFVFQSTLAGGGYPISGLGRGQGVPHSRYGRGGYPMGRGTPPQTWDRVPPQTWDRVPPPPRTWDGVPPHPPDLGWGIPPDLEWGTPPYLGRGTPPPSIASTWYGYAASGMPFAFTQDFLVSYCFLVHYFKLHSKS